jgi:D-xylulose reductase
MHAAVKAKIKPGDLAVVMGAGPIGIVTALAAIAGGCSQVVLTDVQQPKLDLAAETMMETTASDGLCRKNC